MDERTALIDRERRKLAWLREKVAEQERRLRALEELGADPLDEMFERERPLEKISTGEPSAEDKQRVLSAVVQAAAQASAHAEAASRENLERLLAPLAMSSWVRRPRQLPPRWVEILDFIGKDGRTYPEVRNFIETKGLGISPDAVRTGLMNYRRDFGLVENPKRGFYRLSEAGIELVAANKNESLATNSSEAPEPQPT